MSGGRREIAGLDDLLRRADDRDLLRVLGLQRFRLGRRAVPHHQRAPTLGRNEGEAPEVKGQVWSVRVMLTPAERLNSGPGNSNALDDNETCGQGARKSGAKATLFRAPLALIVSIDLSASSGEQDEIGIGPKGVPLP